MVLWLTGMKPDQVLAFGGDLLGTMGCVNSAQIVLEGQGTVANVDISWLTGARLFRLGIHGTAGHMFANVFYDYLREVHGSPNPLDEFLDNVSSIKSMSKYVISGRYFNGAYAVYPQLISDFIKAAKAGREPPVTGEEALEVVKVTEAAKRSLREKRTVRIDELTDESTSPS
jgi:predicted dehydrogenase